MTYKFRIKISGIPLEVETLHTRSQAICRRFETEEDPQLCLSITQVEIDYQKGKCQSIFPQSRELWDGAIEVSVLLEKICNEFVNLDIFALHGASVSDGQYAYLFTARSGTGKTTHIKKWLANVPYSFVVNGDKPFIKFSNNGTILVCGSPWAGKENMYTNTMVPLKSIVLMERAENNHIEQITFADAFPTLLQQVYRPNDEEKMRKTLHLMQKLSPGVTFWRFQCNNFKDDCFDVAYNALVRDQP